MKKSRFGGKSSEKGGRREGDLLEVSKYSGNLLDKLVFDRS